MVCCWWMSIRGRGAETIEGERRRRRRTRQERATRNAHQPALLGEPRLPGARRVAAGDGSAHLLVQLASRRLRDLRGSGSETGDRPGAAGGRSLAVGGRRGVAALERQQLSVLRPDHQGRGRTLRDRHGHALARTARKKYATSSCTAPRARGSTSPTRTARGSSAAT